MPTRRLALLAALVLTTTAGCGSGESADDTSIGPPDPAPAVDTSVEPTTDSELESEAADVVGALRAGGVAVVADDDLTARGQPFAVTEFQAQNLGRQAVMGGGIPGHILRERFPVPDDAVPVDALIAAWLTLDLPGATAARQIVDTSTLTDPALFVYPWAVIDLFIQDIATSDGTDVGPQSLRAPAAARPALAGDPCAVLSTFYEATIGATINALEGSDSILGVVAGQALELFVDVLGAAVSAAVPSAVKVVVQAIAVAAAIAGAIEPWTASLTPDPAATAKGITPAVGNPGSVRLDVATGTNDWPPAVTSCAALAGVDLPQLDPTGATVTWTLVAPDLADETSHEAVVTPAGDGYAANFEYVTRVETVTATSQETSSIIVVDGQVNRNDREQLTKVLGKLIGTAVGGLDPKIAVPLIGTAASELAGLLEVTDPVAPISVIPITYHWTPSDAAGSTLPNITAPAVTTEPSDDCIGTIYGSQGVAGAADVGLYLDPDGSGIFDFGVSQPYNGATVRGIITFSWSGGPETYTTSYVEGTLMVTAAGVTVALPSEALAELGALDETLHCDGSSITIERTGEVYD